MRLFILDLQSYLCGWLFEYCVYSRGFVTQFGFGFCTLVYEFGFYGKGSGFLLCGGFDGIRIFLGFGFVNLLLGVGCKCFLML